MSTVAEIASAIEQLPPEDFLSLREWITKREVGRTGRVWSPEELTDGAQRMIDEPDPVKAQAIWEQTMAGFYGDANA